MMQLNICEEEGSRESLRLSQEAHEGALPLSGQHFTPPGPAQSCQGATVAGRCPPKGRLGNAFEQGGCMAMGRGRGRDRPLAAVLRLIYVVPASGKRASVC